MIQMPTLLCAVCEKQLDSTLDGDKFMVEACATCGRDELPQMLGAQRAYQAKSLGFDPARGTLEERVEYIRWNVLAATDELHELLGEVSWKPWAKGAWINRDEAFGEWIDVWHFLINILWAITRDMGGEYVLAGELTERYFKKRTINVKRQEDGYDGVSGKCPSCKRDMAETMCTKSACRYET